MLKQELAQEKEKKKTGDALLIKLYQELQKLKLVVQLNRKNQSIEDLDQEITRLEAKKKDLEASIAKNMNQDDALVDSTLLKLERYRK